MENLKIEKGKTYTYEEIKEIYKKAIYKKAMMQTMDKPAGNHHTDDAKFQFSMMLSGIVILHTMEDNMFEKEENEDE